MIRQTAAPSLISNFSDSSFDAVADTSETKSTRGLIFSQHRA